MSISLVNGINQGVPLPVQNNRQPCLSVTCSIFISVLVGATIVNIGEKVAKSRFDCNESEITEITRLVESARLELLKSEENYKSTAKLGCDLYFTVLKNPSRSAEVLQFCNGDYPKEKIPNNDESLTRAAKAAIKARNHFENQKARLSDKLSQRPMFCSRGRH